MASVTADLNAYGKYVQLSAIADYLEVAALHDKPIGHAEVAKLVENNDWRLSDFVLLPGEDRADAADIDDARDAATAICAVIDERADVLGDLYPFEWEEGRLRCRIRDVRDDAYVALLSIAVCHAFGLSDEVRPHDVFEHVVAEVMNRCCLKAVNLSGQRRVTGNFDDAVNMAGAAVDLKVIPEAAARMTYAFDEGVDTVCHYTWGDVRPGLWTMIGQATCAKSESWKHKLAEPKPNPWRLMLGVVQPPPWVFLAVPYHVSNDYLLKLVQDGQGIVLDRVRLARFKTLVSDDEERLVESMLGAELE